MLMARWTAMLGTRRSKFAVLKAYERGSLALSSKNGKLRGREAAAPGDGLSGFIVGAEAPQLRGTRRAELAPYQRAALQFLQAEAGDLHFFQPPARARL